MSADSTTFISNLKNVISFSNVSEALNGFSRSTAINSFYNYTHAIDQGASPNPAMMGFGRMLMSLVAGTNVSSLVHAMSWTRTSWLVTPFMMLIPLITHAWPRDDSPNINFNRMKTYLQTAIDSPINSTWPWYIRMVRKLLQGVHFILDKMPILSSPFIKRMFDKINRHMLAIAIAVTIAAYVGLYFYGFAITAVVGAGTLGLGVLDRNNLLPLFLRNFIKKWGMQFSILGGLIAGNPIEMFSAGLSLFIFHGHHVKGAFTRFLNRYEATRPLAREFQEQDRIVRRFDFTCHANQFKDSLLQMANMDCNSSIIRAHVLDNSALLPPSMPDVNLDDLLTLFNDVNWTQAQSVVALNKKYDWRSNRDTEVDAPPLSSEEQYNQDITSMRNNVTTFIQRLRDNDIHSVRHGAEDLVKRYAQSIVFTLNNLQQKSQNAELSADERARHKNTVLDTLIRIGFETGNYCGIGLLRAVESNYRSLFSNRQLTLKERIRFIHQMHRERYFQNQYQAAVLNQIDELTDSHAYGRAVMQYAPRLGLPAAFAENDEINGFVSPLLQDFLSASSPFEAHFWTRLSSNILKKEVKNAMNTPLLPLSEIQQWYHDFIDAHVTGTEEEKEALKEELPYEIEMHDTVPIYHLNDSILHLMLLDFGVIALPRMHDLPENSFRPGATQSSPPVQRSLLQAFNQIAMDEELVPESVTTPIIPTPRRSARLANRT